MGTPAPARGSQAGYNLVTLVVAITVLNILLAAALPYWSAAIQREKEEELIARGLQYAEAIRVFRQRFGRLPVRLEELTEVKPRSIRRLWKDPMTEDGGWGLIFETAGRNPNQPGGEQPPQGQSPQGQGPQGQGPQDQGPQGQGTAQLVATGTGAGREGQVTVGPIAGVHSLSEDESVQVWNGKESYQEWLFTYHLLIAGAGVAPPGAQGPSPTYAFKAEWIGRPFREGIQPLLPAPGNAPGGPGQQVPTVGPDGRPIPPPGPQPPPDEGGVERR